MHMLGNMFWEVFLSLTFHRVVLTLCDHLWEIRGPFELINGTGR